MSTTIPAEIEVPREFLPVFVIAANMAVMDEAARVSTLSVVHTDENRSRDDAALEPVRWSIEARDAILRALDTGARVRVAILETLVESAMRTLNEDVFEEATRADKADEEALAQLVRTATTLQDMQAWSNRNLRDTVAA